MGILDAAKQKLGEAKQFVKEKKFDYDAEKAKERILAQNRAETEREASMEFAHAERKAFSKERAKLAYRQGIERARSEATRKPSMLGRLQSFGIGARMRGETQGMASKMTGVGSGVNLQIGGGMRSSGVRSGAAQGTRIGLGSSISFGGSGRGVIGGFGNAAKPQTQVTKRKVRPTGKTIIIKVQ